MADAPSIPRAVSDGVLDDASSADHFRLTGREAIGAWSSVSRHLVGGLVVDP